MARVKQPHRLGRVHRARFHQPAPRPPLHRESAPAASIRSVPELAHAIRPALSTAPVGPPIRQRSGARSGLIQTRPPACGHAVQGHLRGMLEARWRAKSRSESTGSNVRARVPSGPGKDSARMRARLCQRERCVGCGGPRIGCSVKISQPHSHNNIARCNAAGAWGASTAEPGQRADVAHRVAARSTNTCAHPAPHRLPKRGRELGAPPAQKRSKTRP